MGKLHGYNDPLRSGESAQSQMNAGQTHHLLNDPVTFIILRRLHYFSCNRLACYFDMTFTSHSTAITQLLLNQ